MKLVQLDEADEKRVAKAPAPEMSMEEIERIIAEEDAAEAARKASAGGSAVKPAAPPPRAAAAPAQRPAQAPGPPPSAAGRAAPPRAPTSPAQAPVAVAAAPAGMAQPGGGTGIAEGRPLDEYYALATVPASPYPAEKLLRVIDGLRALDAGTRKAAVLAMDAADDAWSIADVVLDAQRKIAVLTESQRRLQGELEAIGARTIEEQKKLDAYLTQATETIRTKILELEQKLQSETADVTAHKARLAAQVEAASASCAREVARLQIERDRLQEICSTFIVERRG